MSYTITKSAKGFVVEGQELCGWKGRRVLVLWGTTPCIKREAELHHMCEGGHTVENTILRIITGNREGCRSVRILRKGNRIN